MKKKLMLFLNYIKNKTQDTKKSLYVVLSVTIALYVLISLIPYLTSIIIGHKIVFSENEVVSELTSSNELYTYDNNVLLFDSNGIQYYDLKGNFKNNVYFDAYSPYVHAKDDNIAVADIKGKNVSVLKGNKLKYSLKTIDEIKLVSVNDKAYSVIITAEKGYKSLVSAYDSDGENIYQWHMGDDYALDACITDNNKYLAVLSVSVSENNVSSYVTFINLKEETIHSQIKFENELGCKIAGDKNCVYIITDVGLYCVTPDGNVKYDYKYPDTELQVFDIDNKKNIALSFSENNTESKVILLNEKLKVIGECNIPVQVTMIDANSNKVAVVGQNQVFVVDKNRIYAQGTLIKDVSYMRFSDNGRHIFTANGNNVYFYDVKLGR